MEKTTIHLTRLWLACATACIATVVGCDSLPHQVSDSRAGAYEPSLERDRDGFAMAWYDTRDGNAEIYFRLLDADGQPAGPERRLTRGPEQSFEASLARLDDDFIIAWYDQTEKGN